MTVDVATTPHLATQVARLFFERQLTKVEIAAHLGISRFRVARLIDTALADGLVRIEYRDVPGEDRGLATAIEERYGLAMCAVASGTARAALDGAVRDGSAGDGTATRLAAAVLDGLIGPDEVIGIAWGSTLAAVVREMPARREPGVEVVQLAGSSTRLERDRDAGELARALAERLGASYHAIYAPAFVGSTAVRDELLAQPEVAEAADRFSALTLAIVGIGAMPAEDDGPASSLLRSGVLDAVEVVRLVGLGAIGDLVVHPFDDAGRFVAPDLAARAIAIGVDELRSVPRVLAVAAGPAKAGAIRGALASGVIDILVTDAPTARTVLDGA